MGDLGAKYITYIIEGTRLSVSLKNAGICLDCRSVMAFSRHLSEDACLDESLKKSKNPFSISFGTMPNRYISRLQQSKGIRKQREQLLCDQWDKGLSFVGRR